MRGAESDEALTACLLDGRVDSIVIERVGKDAVVNVDTLKCESSFFCPSKWIDADELKASAFSVSEAGNA